MTDEERAKQVLYDLSRKEKEFSKEQEELRKIGLFLRKLGPMLMERPDRVVFPSQTTSANYINVKQLSPPTNALSEDYLREKTEKIRELKEAIGELKREKRDLGL